MIVESCQTVLSRVSSLIARQMRCTPSWMAPCPESPGPSSSSSNDRTYNPESRTALPADNRPASSSHSPSTSASTSSPASSPELVPLRFDSRSRGESPRGVSPRGARRTVREPLDSYSSHHGATPHPHLPVGKQRRRATRDARDPVCCSPVMAAQLLVFSLGP